MYDPNAIKIYTDGSALNNPGGAGGIGGIIEYPDDLNLQDEIIIDKGYQKTTNNRMELRACMEAIKYIIKNISQFKSWGLSRAIIITDSQYVNNYQNTALSWKKNGGKNSSGRPIENMDLWKEFLSLRAKCKFINEIFWKHGKSNQITNDVDKIAKRAAKKSLRVIDSGYKQERVSRTKTKEQGASTLFPANNQQSVIRIYRYSLTGKTDYKIFFDLFSEEKNDFIGKYHAYISKEKKDKIHRHQLCKVSFNGDVNYPIIEAIEILEDKKYGEI